jgi:hypothetical protein
MMRLLLVSTYLKHIPKMSTWSDLLPRAIRQYITEFQCPTDTYFIICNPVSFMRCYSVTDENDPNLLQLRRCRYLSLYQPVQTLVCTSLRSLRVCDSVELTEPILQCLPHLEFLHLGARPHLRNESFQYVPCLKVLDWNRRHFDPVLPLDSRLFKWLKQLLHLDCKHRLSRSVDVSEMMCLQSLSLHDDQYVSDECIRSLDQLQVLVLNNTLTDEGLRNKPFLHTLSINSHITFEGMKNLRLRRLCINHNTHIRDHHLRQCTHLVDLRIGHGNITDEGIRDLIQLEKLFLGECASITDYGIEQLVHLTELDTGLSTQITDASLVHMTHLKVLKCGNNVGITTKSIKQLFRLRELHLGHATQVTPRSFNRLVHLSILALDWNSQCARGANLQCLVNLTTLHLGVNEYPPLVRDGVRIFV